MGMKINKDRLVWSERKLVSVSWSRRETRSSSYRKKNLSWEETQSDGIRKGKLGHVENSSCKDPTLGAAHARRLSSFTPSSDTQSNILTAHPDIFSPNWIFIPLPLDSSLAEAQTRGNGPIKVNSKRKKAFKHRRGLDFLKLCVLFQVAAAVQFNQNRN